MPVAPARALDLLKQRPELAPQFREKYGYVPAPQRALDLLTEQPDLAPQFEQKYGYLPEQPEDDSSFFGSALKNAGRALYQSSLNTVAEMSRQQRKLLFPEESEKMVRFREERGLPPLELAGEEPTEGEMALIRASNEIEETLRRERPPEASEDPWSVKGLTYNVLEGAARMAPGIVGSLVTRKPMFGSAFVAGDVFGASVAEGRQMGLDADEAARRASVLAVGEFVTELIPIGLIIKPGQKFLSGVGKAAISEGIQEMAAETINIGYDAGILDEEMTWAEAAERLGYSAVVGGAIGGALRGGAHPFTGGGAEPSAPIPPVQDAGQSAKALREKALAGIMGETTVDEYIDAVDEASTGDSVEPALAEAIEEIDPGAALDEQQRRNLEESVLGEQQLPEGDLKDEGPAIWAQLEDLTRQRAREDANLPADEATSTAAWKETLLDDDQREELPPIYQEAFQAEREIIQRATEELPPPVEPVEVPREGAPREPQERGAEPVTQELPPDLPPPVESVDVPREGAPRVQGVSPDTPSEIPDAEQRVADQNAAGEDLAAVARRLGPDASMEEISDEALEFISLDNEQVDYDQDIVDQATNALQAEIEAQPAEEGPDAPLGVPALPEAFDLEVFQQRTSSIEGIGENKIKRPQEIDGRLFVATGMYGAAEAQQVRALEVIPDENGELLGPQGQKFARGDEFVLTADGRVIEGGQLGPQETQIAEGGSNDPVPLSDITLRIEYEDDSGRVEAFPENAEVVTRQTAKRINVIKSLLDCVSG